MPTNVPPSTPQAALADLAGWTGPVVCTSTCIATPQCHAALTCADTVLQTQTTSTLRTYPATLSHASTLISSGELGLHEHAAEVGPWSPLVHQRPSASTDQLGAAAPAG